MIYTVASSDKDSWQDNEGADGIPQGLAFTGEQNIADSGGNSIVCLYNGANALSLIYQIVKHDTTTEVPVVASFITTDIDIAQGVQTNLANLVTILPQTTNLKQDGDTIYDASPNYPGLDGVASLPYGGYLGAGFVSEFYYNYYAPAPERAEDSYFFAQGVRYDLFGSALQAHMNTQIRQNFIVNYYDEFGHKIQDTDHYIGFTGQDYNLPIPTIPYYGFVNMTENDSVKNNPVINLIYTQSLPNYYGYPQTSSYGYSGNNIQYAGVNYKPSFTINYQNTGLPTATITYSPINSSKADSVTIPLTMSGGNTDIIYPSMQSVANKNSFSNSMNVNYENMAKNFGITSDQAKELYNDLYVASTTLEKNPNDGFADYLAGVHYSDGFAGLLQKPLNSIPKGYDYSKISDILGVINKKGNGIDLSHLGTSMGAYYETGAIKISGNLLAGGYSLPALIESLTGHDSNLRDTKLMTDTLTGDALTNLNASDEAADMDAYILTHFPDYKGLTTAEAFAKYYSLPNLDTALREKMYLESMSGGKGDSGVAMGGFAVFSLAFASLGTAYAAGGGLYGLFKSLKDRNAAAKSLQTTGKLVGQLTKISGDALKRVVTKKVQQLSTSIQKVVKVVQNTANSLKNKAISAFKGATQSVSQVFNSFKAKVISVGQNVKSFINQGVKVAKQSLNTVIEVAKQKAAAAAQAFRQTSQWLTQQARNTGNAIWNGVQTAYHTVSNFVTGVYNNYVAPTVNYVTNTVSKVYNNYVKPVVNSAIHAYHAVTNFIGSAYNSAKSWVSNKVNAVGKWLKSLW